MRQVLIQQARAEEGPWLHPHSAVPPEGPERLHFAGRTAGLEGGSDFVLPVSSLPPWAPLLSAGSLTIPPLTLPESANASLRKGVRMGSERGKAGCVRDVQRVLGTGR